MRALYRTAGPALVRDVGALAAATAIVGVSFGAIATSGGIPLWAVVAMSVLVFAGGSQFAAASLVAAGSPVAAVLAGLLLNARHLPFGVAIGDVLGRGSRRLLGSHLMTDEAVAFALAQPDPRRRRVAYWLTGAALFAGWNAGAVIGAMVGGALGDPGAFGLDAAFPAGIFALLLPAISVHRPNRLATGAEPSDPGARAGGASARTGDPAGRYVALAAALIAVAATPLVPAGLPVLLALAALGVALVVPMPRTAATC